MYYICNKFHIMKSNFLKLSFKVELIGNSGVTIELLNVNDCIHKYHSIVIFVSKNGYVFEKSEYFKYTKTRLMIPYEIKPTRRYVCNLEFDNDEVRHYYLKKFAKSLLELSDGTVFSSMPKSKLISNKLSMSGKFWFLY